MLVVRGATRLLGGTHWQWEVNEINQVLWALMSLGTVGADLNLVAPDLPHRKGTWLTWPAVANPSKGDGQQGPCPGLPPRPHSPRPAGKRKQMFSQQTGREMHLSPGPGNWKETPPRHGCTPASRPAVCSRASLWPRRPHPLRTPSQDRRSPSGARLGRPGARGSVTAQGQRRPAPRWAPMPFLSLPRGLEEPKALAGFWGRQNRSRRS